MVTLTAPSTHLASIPSMGDRLFLKFGVAMRFSLRSGVVPAAEENEFPWFVFDTRDPLKLVCFIVQVQIEIEMICFGDIDVCVQISYGRFEYNCVFEL